MTQPAVAAYPVRITWWAENRSPEDRFVISLLCADAPDEVLLDPTGRVVAQRTLDSLVTRAKSLGYDLEPHDAHTIDVRGARALIRPRPSESDCSTLIDSWHFLVEVGRSTGRHLVADGKGAEAALEMLFWGSGILRPDDVPPWQPRLSRPMRRKIHQVLTRGIRVLDDHIGSGRDDLFERITLAVNAEDPAGVLDAGGHYEYEPEVIDLIRLGRSATAKDVLDVFDRWFEDSHALDGQAAERIADVLRQG